MTAPERAPVVIGLGGNVGSELAIVARFHQARSALAALGPVRSAALYRSDPIGPAQPVFLNTAVCIELGEAGPDALLATLHGIERRLGRDRQTELRWGPRPIDLDILVWGARVVRSPELWVPHPRLAERKFALAPLVDLLGAAFEIPGAGTAGALLHRAAHQGLARVAETW